MTNEPSMPVADMTSHPSGRPVNPLSSCLRTLREEFPTALPVTVYRRPHIFCHKVTHKYTYDFRASLWVNWCPIYGTCGPSDCGKRLIILIGHHQDPGYERESLMHEWAHAVVWPYKNKEHPIDYFVVYGKIYQRCVDDKWQE